MNRPTLRGERLLLRPFEPEDAPVLQELAGAWEVADGTLSVPHPYEAGMAEEWITEQQGEWEGDQALVLAVTHPEEGLVGTVGLSLVPEHERAEVGYWIGVPYWGRGYATEAVGRMLDWAFAERGLRRVEAFCYPGNPGSARVLEKVAMRREGRLRQRVLRWGEPRDVVAYSILADEWRGADRR